MNIVFWLLLFVAAVILWFTISFIFIPVGRAAIKKWKNIIGIMNKEDDVNEKEKKDE